MAERLKNTAGHPVPLHDGRSVGVGESVEVDKITGVTKDAVEANLLVVEQEAEEQRDRQEKAKED